MREKRNYSTITKNTVEGPTKLHFMKSHVKFFNNSLHLQAQLSTHEMCFYRFLCENSDALNKIHIDKMLQEDFLNFLAKINVKTCSEKTLLRAKTKLVKLNLLLEYKESKHIFIVNPKHAFKGSEIKRIELIRNLLNAKESPIKDKSKLLNEAINLTQTKV